MIFTAKRNEKSYKSVEGKTHFFLGFCTASMFAIDECVWVPMSYINVFNSLLSRPF